MKRLLKSVLLCLMLVLAVVAYDETGMNNRPNLLDEITPVAKIDADGVYSSLQSETELGTYFTDALRVTFGQDVKVISKDENLHIQSNLVSAQGSDVLNESTTLASVDFLEVRDVPVVDEMGEETGEFLPYLALKGNKADGNCVTKMIPVEQKGELFYISKDLKSAGIEVQSHPHDDDCDYTHGCSGDPCTQCHLSVSADGCSSWCSCTDRHTGSRCNNFVLTN